MSFPNFDALTSRFPAHKKRIKRISRLVEESQLELQRNLQPFEDDEPILEVDEDIDITADLSSDSSQQRQQGHLHDSLQRGPEFTFDQLQHELAPIDAPSLALLLEAMVQSGIAARLIRVRSRSGPTGIGSFPSLESIPEEIYDPVSGTAFEVTPEDLSVVYRFPARA